MPAPACLIFISAVFLTSACSLVTPARTQPHPPFTVSQGSERTPLLVFSHGHHSGLVLPRYAIKKALPSLALELHGEWLEFGWGDEGFYREMKVTLPLAFRAMAYPTPGVMHVFTSDLPLHEQYAYAPAYFFELNSAQRDILVERLARQFTRDERGQLRMLGQGRYGTSRFYRARERFYFPQTCNRWTSQHLQAIGYNVSGITAPALFSKLEKLGRNSRSRSDKTPP